MNISSRNTERGNVLFYILVAVVLLAALTYAVAQSGRGNVQKLSDEKARLLASELIEYANTVANAVGQLRLRGVDLDELCFDHPNWGASDYNHAGCSDNFNKIYHPDGGGLTWTQANADAMDSTASPDNLWHFYSDNEIQDVGTTAGDSSSTELIIMVDELQQNVCQQINGLLGVTDADTAPPTDTAYGETRYVGAFGYTATIGDEAGGAALDGKPAGCFQAGGKYAFYKVLVAR